MGQLYQLGVGLEPALLIAIAAATVVLTAILVGWLRGGFLDLTDWIRGESSDYSPSTSPRTVSLVLLQGWEFISGMAIIALAVCIAVFCAAFAVLNLLLQTENLDASLVETELSSGVLGLRISSLLVCYRTLGYASQLLFGDLLRVFPVRFFERPSQKYPALNDLPELLPDRKQDILHLSQYGVYLIVLTNLWLLTVLGEHSPLLALLNWAFFFIIDDWALMTEYGRSLKGRMFPWHLARIHAFNAILIVPLVIIVFQVFPWYFAGLSVFFMGYFLAWRY